MWGGSRVVLDSWCPRGTGYFVAPMMRPLAQALGPRPGMLDFDLPFVVLHPQADPSPVMAAHLAEAYAPDGVLDLVGCWG